MNVNKRTLFLPTASILAILIQCLILVRTAPAEEYRDKLIKYLKMGPATILKLNAHDRTAVKIDSRLSELYRDNGFRLFWVQDDRTNARALAIRSVLEGAGSQGLVPEDYFVREIGRLWGKTSPMERVRLDVFLSLGMMRYVADQREGRMAPHRLDPKLFAAARDTIVDWKILRRKAFKAPDMKTFLDAQAPPFFQYRALVKQLARYRTIAATGSWPTIPEGRVLKPAMTDQRVKMLRKRLAVSGELAADNMGSPVFDTAVERGVKKFQRHHNLAADGVVGKQTLAAMNVSVESRIRQIIINMERYRWLKRSIMSERLVAVNIAGFEAFAGKPGHLKVKMPVIVGKSYHMTPVFNSTIKYVVFNPYWNVPPSIAQNEMLPKLRKDAHYLAKNNMRLFRGWGADAPELNAATIDWHKISKRDMNRYHIRQDPGPDNALGTLKLVFPNKYNVYLHDTPAHGLFKREKRTFSHGCIRMSRPVEMASWVLGGEKNGWGMKRVRRIIASRKRQVVNLKKPVAVYILYRTADVNPDDNTLSFYNDVYGRDTLLAKALFSRDMAK